MVDFSDLALEAEFLASLNHPHIMKLRGLAFNGTSGFETGPTGYFLIIDRLFETLDDRIEHWTKSSAVVEKGRSLSFRRSIKSRRSFSVPEKLRASSLPSSTKETEAEDTQLDERLSVGEFDDRMTSQVSTRFHLNCLCSLSRRYVLTIQLSK